MNSIHPLISVIIPVYNVAPWLPRCLNSVIGNTYQNLEIICVNDGSTDDSLRILREYETHDSRIRIIGKENGGLSSARNAGMDIASGEFIAFIDSDDWVHPQYFELLLYAQQQADADIAIGEHIRTDALLPADDPRIDPSSVSIRRTSIEETIAMRHTRYYVWGRLYRACLLRDHRFIEGALFEDTPFNLMLLSRHAHLRIALVSQPLYYYFIRPSSIVNTASHIEMLDICQAYCDQITPRSSAYEKHILMEEAIKKLLIVRYEATLLRHAEALAKADMLMRKCLPILLKTKSLPLKKKIQYTFLAAFPELYRQFRIKDDPTLLDWEKQIKAKESA